MYPYNVGTGSLVGAVCCDLATGSGRCRWRRRGKHERLQELTPEVVSNNYGLGRSSVLGTTQTLRVTMHFFNGMNVG